MKTTPEAREAFWLAVNKGASMNSALDAAFGAMREVERKPARIAKLDAEVVRTCNEAAGTYSTALADVLRALAARFAAETAP
jgi:hypothetical protein